MRVDITVEEMMIRGLHHIAIIASSEKSIAFFEQLGFAVSDVVDRGYDKIYFMNGYGEQLEIFIDPTHPKRVDRPEARGLRHIAFQVDNIDEVLEKFECEPVRGERGSRFTFAKDPDGLPIEFHE